MARQVRAGDDPWPAELVEFDPERWSSRAAWHLARAEAASTTLDRLNEIRAAVGRPPLEAWPGGLTQRVIGPPGRPRAGERYEP
jgi:hypothetical protein